MPKLISEENSKTVVVAFGLQADYNAGDALGDKIIAVFNSMADYQFWLSDPAGGLTIKQHYHKVVCEEWKIMSYDKL